MVHIAGDQMEKDQRLHFLQESSEKVDIVRGGMSPRHLFAMKRDFASIREHFKRRSVLLYGKIKKISEEMVRDGMSHPTMFEIETALSFLYFLDKKVDVVYWKQEWVADLMQRT